jgi:hypothetical protein
MLPDRRRRAFVGMMVAWIAISGLFAYALLRFPVLTDTASDEQPVPDWLLPVIGAMLRLTAAGLLSHGCRDGNWSLSRRDSRVMPGCRSA